MPAQSFSARCIRCMRQQVTKFFLKNITFLLLTNLTARLQEPKYALSDALRIWLETQDLYNSGLPAVLICFWESSHGLTGKTPPFTLKDRKTARRRLLNFWTTTKNLPKLRQKILISTGQSLTLCTAVPKVLLTA